MVWRGFRTVVSELRLKRHKSQPDNRYSSGTWRAARALRDFSERLPLAQKAAVILFLLASGGIIALGTFFWFLGRTADDSRFEVLAARQRMLVQEMYTYALGARIEEPGIEDRLLSIINEFDSSLWSFEMGGGALGVHIPPAPPEFHPALMRIKRTWVRLRGPLLLLAEEPRNTPELRGAFKAAQRGLPQLAAGTTGLAALFEERKQRLRANMLTVLFSICFVNLLFVVAALRFTKRQIAAPIAEVTHAARLFQTGNFSARVRVRAKNELAELAETFNRMAANVAWLVARVQASEARFRGLFENVPEGVCKTTTEGRITAANPALLSMLGLEKEEDLFLDTLNSYVAGQAKTPKEEAFPGAAQTRNLELQLRRTDGRTITVLANTCAVRDESNNIIGYQTTLTDISDRKDLEQQLRQSQKMEAVGRLAGGVAHDFNNLLTVILGYSEFALESLPKGDPVRDSINEICGAAKRAERLTQQLLAFSRKQVARATVLDLNSVIHGMETMLRRLIGEHIQLHLALHPNLWPIYADHGQMEQVVMNLALNARDAMPTGGVLRIETANVYLDESTIGQNSLQLEPGPCVILSVADDGAGMTDEVLSHLFEPFFSTKEKGKGTGMGLSMVYGIVRQSGGDVRVGSQPGMGSVFQIMLKRAGRVETSSLPEPEETSPGQAHGETILLVEDEAGVRQFAAEALRRRGFKVLEATDGREGLRTFERHRAEIDLVLTDVVMPAMTGRELAQIMRAKDPSLPVLYMSGYTDDIILSYGLDGAEIPLLSKPFTADVLTRRVQQTLAASGSRSSSRFSTNQH
ncbi:MAG TPA: ATP-binding protein [Bryobacteraceae bacterium]|nr:ATP-binding protein [Bryobacteraceae bacterium]